MFTLKLYKEERTRIVAGDSVTVYHYSSRHHQITVHKAFGKGLDECFYVDDGWPGFDKDNPTFNPNVLPQDVDWYDAAIVENEMGRTTEKIGRPRLRVA